MEKGGKLGREMHVCYAHSQKHAASIWSPEVDTVCFLISPYLIFKGEGPPLNLELPICLNQLSSELLESVYLHAFPHSSGVTDMLLCPAFMPVPGIQTHVLMPAQYAVYQASHLPDS